MALFSLQKIAGVAANNAAYLRGISCYNGGLVRHVDRTQGGAYAEILQASVTNDSRDGEVQRAMELLSQKDVMLSLFNKVTSPVGVLFGDDTEISELQPATLVIARYGHGGHELGKIGVIGPTRMSYDRVIPSLEYFASKMSKVITQNLTDLED
jgi:transcriptional regulator of heat shock response